MARAAGTSREYEFLLNGDKSLPSIKLTSVTTILHDIFGANQWVVNWAANNFKDADEMHAYREQRSVEGMAAHAYAEDYVERVAKGSPIVAPESGFDRAFDRFVAEHDPVFTHSETIVYSLRHAYAGTLDLGLLDVGGAVRIVDIKTRGKKIYKAYLTDRLQCRLYAMAAYEMGLIPSPDGPTATLMIKDNGRYTFDDTSETVETAEAVLTLHKLIVGRS